eukprot:TRINITY_DN6026_c0_g1_i3.p2 TRINITY_DN6026_c0_g1~~TRINITY_DN6026_c0_g1_i3.p2  ORF type:complete len:123 (-),score=18.38 TRINITY_DN6026_c0_g1_i3:345-713(-)
MQRGLVGSEMCIRDRVSTQSTWVLKVKFFIFLELNKNSSFSDKHQFANILQSKHNLLSNLGLLRSDSKNNADDNKTGTQIIQKIKCFTKGKVASKRYKYKSQGHQRINLAKLCPLKNHNPDY